MEEILQVLWQNIVAIFAGVSVGGVVTAIVTVVIRAFGDKITKKVDNKLTEIDVDKIKTDAADRALKKMKSITYKQSIQPIVKSELMKITEATNEALELKLQTINEKYDKLLVVVEQLGCYFDNSIGVPEENKTAFHDAVEQAKRMPCEIESVSVVIEDEPFAQIEVEEVEQKEEKETKKARIRR